MVPALTIQPVRVVGVRPPGPPPLKWSPKPFGMAKPALRRMAGRDGLGQAAGIAAMGAIPLLIGAALGAGAAWVGFTTGKRESGLLSAVGYVIGSIGALSALGGLVGSLLWIAGVSAAAKEIESPRVPSIPTMPPALPPLPPMGPGEVTLPY